MATNKPQTAHRGREAVYTAQEAQALREHLINVKGLTTAQAAVIAANVPRGVASERLAANLRRLTKA